MGTVPLGCIADDLTGATDLALTLTREGMRTFQTSGPPAPGLDLADVDAIPACHGRAPWRGRPWRWH